MGVSVVINPAGGGLGLLAAGGRQSGFITRALAVVPFADPVQFFDDFVAGTILWSASGVGTVTRSATIAKLSTLLASTGAGAGQTGAIILGNNPGAGGNMTALPGGATSKFYIEWRMRVMTAIDNVAVLGIIGGSGVVTAGVTGASSITNYTAKFDTGASQTLTSTIAIDAADTNTRVHRLWKDGTANAFYSVEVTPNTYNFETPIVSTGASMSTTGQSLFLGAQNGATAANRACELEYFGMCWDRV